MQGNESHGQVGGLDGLVGLQDYPRITGPVDFTEGILTMTRRLRLSPERVRRLAKDRCPVRPAKVENQAAKHFRFRHYLTFDVVYTDILHTGYEELKHLGLGRRYLKNRLLRAVLAGVCDGMDPTRRAGDFSPRSWMDEQTRKEVLKIQREVIRILEVEQAGLWRSVKVRFYRFSTAVLQAFCTRLPEIREMVGRESSLDPRNGLKAFSRYLSQTKTACDRKRDYTRNWWWSHQRKTRRRRYYKIWKAQSTLTKACVELRRRLDPKQPCWYRRPTDADWREERKSSWSHHVFASLHRRDQLKNVGLGKIPGISAPINDTDWFFARTDWTVSEARALLKSEQNEVKSQEFFKI